MLVRIVKLTFEKKQITRFKQIFKEHQKKIQDFEGFSFLELYQVKDRPNTFFTRSHWKDETALENYRNSEYFKKIWSETKVLFAAKPEAWSLEKTELNDN